MADIKRALVKIFGTEGGYVNDPHDPGGETRYGISKRSYPHVNIAALTIDRAADIYRADYWDRLSLGDIVNQTIAEEIFDTAVNCGVGTAAKIAQEAVNLTNYPEPDVGVDGRIGPKTIAAINNHKSPLSLYKALNGLQFVRYMNICKAKPMQERFMRGWLKRVFESGGV